MLYSLIESLVQDIRYGFRGLRRNPGFTALIVVSLALGISVNTAIFSLADTVLLRQLSYGEPERLVVISEEPPQPYREEMRPRPLVDFSSRRDSLKSYDGIMGIGSAAMGEKLVGVQEARELKVGPVSADICTIFRVQPLVGRCFTAAEEATQAPVALVSHSLWQNLFGGNPAILGRTLTFRRDDQDSIVTIVGVMPAGFRLYTLAHDLWMPMPPG